MAPGWTGIASADRRRRGAPPGAGTKRSTRATMPLRRRRSTSPARPARIVLFNKPWGVLSQFTDAEGRATLKDYVDLPGVYPAGRLDRDSEGLLVLTDDGALKHRIAHPRAKLAKTYWAQVEGDPADVDLAPLRAGITLADGPCRPARCALMEPPPALWPRDPPVRFRRNVPDRWLSITLTEGRNRQVRRMCAAAGFPVLRLIRWAVGEWTLAGLAPGEYRLLEHGSDLDA